jgi:hypothetical protein
LLILNTIYNNTIKPQHNLNYSIPSNVIKTQLLAHQSQLVNAMHLYRNKLSKGFVNGSHVINGKIGIIGDSYGTGKTLSVLSYLASTSSLLQQQNVSIELDTNSTKYFYSHNMYELTNNRISNLIIVPHQLFTQWKTEITKHTSLKFVPIETRRFIKGEELANTIINSSFVLTTSKCYKYVQEFAIQNNITWNNIFIDEATSIYLSPSDPSLQFQFLWFITNDWLPLIFRYTNLNKNELYTLKDRLQPSLHAELEEWLLNNKLINQDNHIVSSGYLREYLPYLHQLRGHIVLRNSLEYINSSIKLPNIINNIINCKPLLSINSIISYINTHYNDISNYSSILDNITRIFQALNIEFIDFDKYLWKQPVYKHALIKRKYAEEECVICLDKSQSPTIVKCCYNIYCGKCLLRNMLVNQKCPTCRCQLTMNDISCIGELTDEMRINGKSKQETCLNLIEYNIKDTIKDTIKDNIPNKNKYIIYTMFDNIYYQMHSSFIEKGIIAERIENNLFSILKTVKNFNEGSTQVLFISNPMLIRGMSFTNTTHLIFFHETPFFEMEQVLIHSAQRIGREKDLQIYHLNSEFVL